MKTLLFIFTWVSFMQISLAQDSISLRDIRATEKILSLQFSKEKSDSMAEAVKFRAKLYKMMHHHSLSNPTPLPSFFTPVLPGMRFEMEQLPVQFFLPETQLPARKNDLAFYSIPQLAFLIKNKKISSQELTKFFLNRLKKYDDTLKSVISITEDIALKEAAQADREIAEGNYKGPLHGIPYGLKDLFAVKGTRTTWGAAPFQDQIIEENSYAYSKLRKAGAVLVAKLSVGALAMGDHWFGGQTKNPWNLRYGSSGSSAGSAAATVAGLVPFAIGTETYGSIISPATICGATGLRPTFGSVSRTGAMTLSWSLDKTGPLCRSAEDAAIVFYYLHGSDRELMLPDSYADSDPTFQDASARDMPFNYKGKPDLSNMKIAFAENYFRDKDTMGNETHVLEVFRKAGARLTGIHFPDSGIYLFNMMNIIIGAESAAAFDDFTRSGQDDKMIRQGKGEWPNFFRAARLIPAVEYLNANRHRYLLMKKVNAVIEQYDAIICPSWGGNQLAITNLTGHPAVVFPTGFNKNNLPTSITLIGRLYDEATLLEIARAYQDATPWNKMTPQLFK